MKIVPSASASVAREWFAAGVAAGLAKVSVMGASNLPRDSRSRGLGSRLAGRTAVAGLVWRDGKAGHERAGQREGEGSRLVNRKADQRFSIPMAHDGAAGHAERGFAVLALRAEIAKDLSGRLLDPRRGKAVGGQMVRGAEQEFVHDVHLRRQGRLAEILYPVRVQTEHPIELPIEMVPRRRYHPIALAEPHLEQRAVESRAVIFQVGAERADDKRLRGPAGPSPDAH